MAFASKNVQIKCMNITIHIKVVMNVYIVTRQ